VFLIDHIDRANEQAANSLLKILEEPPAHLVLFMTAENAYDLRGSCGFSFGNGCSDGATEFSLFGQKKFRGNTPTEVM